MKAIWIAGLIIALLVGSASADPFIGNTLRYSIDVADGVDVTALGDTDVDLGTGDITTTGAVSVGTVTETGGEFKLLQSMDRDQFVGLDYPAAGHALSDTGRGRLERQLHSGLAGGFWRASSCVRYCIYRDGLRDSAGAKLSRALN